MRRFKKQKVPPPTHLLPPSRRKPVHPMVHWMWEEINNQAVSQQDIAQRADVSPSAMRRWRTGEREPSYQGLEAVVNALGYDLVLRKRERTDVGG